MPIYGLSISSNAIPTDVFNSLSDRERSEVFAGFKQNVESNLLNPTFGTGNWQVGAVGVLSVRNDDDGQTRLVYDAEINSQVFVPQDQLPPSITGFDAPSNVTAGPDSAVAATSPTEVAAEITPNVSEVIPVQAPEQVTTSAPSQFLTFYDPDTGTWSVFDTTTNSTVQSGLSEQQAILAEQDLNISPDGITLNSSTTADEDPFEQSRLEAEERFNLPPPTEADVITGENSITSALTAEARNQQTIRSLRNTKAQSSDWRVRLSLAPNSNYLYNDQQPGLLAPLKNTNGVIFPYTPSIETAYKANYDAYDLTHSNYRGYFYKNSYVDAVNLRATFTAQDTNEANYLLAVIHFFRSATKMFYGQDPQRGAPPPLVYIRGYGDFQFNNHPCLINQFNYTLPPDVDYIRAQSVLSNNTNLQLARLRNTIANNPLSYSVNRILNSGLLPGALDFRPSTTNNLGVGNPTYVPTKMEISVSLLPIQSRQQVSKNFKMGDFANGNLLRGGFW